MRHFGTDTDNNMGTGTMSSSGMGTSYWAHNIVLQLWLEQYFIDPSRATL